MGELFSADECEERASQALSQADEIGNVEIRMELFAEATAFATLAIAKRSGYVRQENMHGTTVRVGDEQ